MAEKDQLDEPKKDEEWIKSSPKALPRRRRIKCLGIIIAGILLQIVIIGVLGLTVFRFKDPDIKLGSLTLENMSIVPGSPASINVTLKAEIAIKNQNWGEYKFDESSAVLSYRGTVVGQREIPKGRVKMRRIGRVVVVVEANFDGLWSTDGNLSRDINSGVLSMSSYTKLSGKVNMLMMIKKRRTGEMNCTTTVSLTTQTIQDYRCQ